MNHETNRALTIVTGAGSVYLGWWLVSTPTPDLLWEIGSAAAVLDEPMGYLLILTGIALVALGINSLIQ